MDLPGLEMRLSSRQAVEAAKKFSAAIESAAVAVERAGRSIDSADRRFDELGRGVSRATPSVRRFGDAATETTRRIDELRRSGGSTASVLKRLAAAIGGIAVGRQAIRSFSDLERNLAVLSGVTKATGDDLERLKITAREAARSTGLFNTGEAVQGLTELARAGFSAADASVALGGATELAAAGGISIAQSANTVVKTLNQFALAASDAGNVVDTLVAASNSGATDVPQLSAALAKAGTNAKLAGLGLQETAAAAVKLFDLGRDADTAGTGLGRVLQRLISPSDAAKKALSDVGLSIDDVDVRVRGLNAVLATLAEVGIDGKLAKSIAEAEFGPLLINLVEVRDGIEDLKDSLGSVDGAALAAITPQVSTLSGATKSLTAEFGNLSDSLASGGTGDFLQAVTRGTADFLAQLSGAESEVEALTQGGRRFADALKLATAAGAGFVSLKLANVLTTTAASMKLTAATTSITTKSIVGITQATGASTVAAAGSASAFRTLSAAIASNPFGAAAVAISTVASALLLFSDNSERVSAAAAKQAQDIKNLRNNMIELQRATGVLTDEEALRRGLLSQGVFDSAVNGLRDLRGGIGEAERGMISAARAAESSSRDFEAAAVSGGTFFEGLNQRLSESFQQLGQELREATGSVDISKIAALAPLLPGNDEALRIAKLRDRLGELQPELLGAANEAERLRERISFFDENDIDGAQFLVRDLEAARGKIAEIEQQIRSDISRLGEGLSIQFEPSKIEIDADTGEGVAVPARLTIDTGAARKTLDELREELARIGRDAGLAIPPDLLKQAFESPKQSAEELRPTIKAILKDLSQQAELAEKVGLARKQELAVQRAAQALGGKLTEIEGKRIRNAVELVEKGEQEARQKAKAARDEQERLRIAAKLPERYGDLVQSLQSQLELAKAEGDERVKIGARIKAENDAKAIGLALDDERFKKLVDIRSLIEDAGAASRGLSASSAQSIIGDLEREQSDLRQSIELMGLFGDERERVIRAQLTENALREAGIAANTEAAASIGSLVDANRDLLTELEKRERLEQDLSSLGSVAGDAIGSQLLDAAERGKKLRDVLRGIGDDLRRIAFDRLVTRNLADLFGGALASLGASGTPSASGGGVASGGFTFLGGGAGTAATGTAAAVGRTPLILGGVLPSSAGEFASAQGFTPAQIGQIITEPSLINRGSRQFSVAEGGGTTPEAILPLERDGRGRLGVTASDVTGASRPRSGGLSERELQQVVAVVERAGSGAGTNNISMSFPSVRNAQDARDQRATLGQSVRRALSAAGQTMTSSRGMRPAGR